MPKTTGILTASAVRKAEPLAKPAKLADGGGMYLLLKPDGSRYWRLDYRFEGKRKTLALGVYPAVSLAEARRRRREARNLLAQGIDPMAAKKAGKTARTLDSEGAWERSISRRHKLLQTIASVNEMFTGNLDEQQLMDRICLMLVQDRQFRMAWIGLIADDGVRVQPVAEAGFEEGYLAGADVRCDESRQGQGPTGTAIRHGVTVINDDTETNRPFAPWRERARAQGYRSSAATPLRLRGRVAGAVNVYSGEPNAFGPDEVVLLEKLATDLGAAMDRLAAEAALRESEAQFRLLLDSSAEAIYGVDTQGICTFVNPACLRMLGYAREEDLIGKSLHDLIHHTYPDGRPYPKVCCHVRLSTLEGQSTHVDDEVHWRADGTSFPVEYWSHPMHRNGELVGAVVTFVDITERKRTEAALRESEERYRLISSLTSDLVYSCSQTGAGHFAIDWLAGSVDRVFGYSPDEFLEQRCWRCHVHPDDLAIFDRNITALTPGQESECELRVLAKDGSCRYLRAYSKVVEADTGPGQNRLYGACQDITEHKAAEARIEYLAHHDALTGLPNRILLRDRFRQALALAERSHERVAVLFLDLDNFKLVNDTLGHAAGDRLLQAVVDRLDQRIRDTDTACRQGGDEFILLLGGIPDPATVERIASDVLLHLAEPVEIDDHVLNLTCSIGISLYPDDGRDFDILLQKADSAMYSAKDSGRNAYRFFDEEMNRLAHEHLLLQNRLRQALGGGEFSLHYQPQLDITDGRVLGVEALLRWHNPELGDIAPGRFIPVAEECGLIVPIGAWVLEEACRQARAWLDAGLPELIVSVNLSALQLRRANLVETVAAALRDSGLPPRLLELELTESILLQDVENTLQTVQRLKALGVRLAIDDFGTGYSSLSYLKRFAVDKLKIDQSFVRDIGTDPDDAAIVRAIIQLARSLRLEIIAEGVETEEQRAFLLAEGCRHAQGYLFSRPLPPAVLEAFLRMQASGWLAAHAPAVEGGTAAMP